MKERKMKVGSKDPLGPMSLGLNIGLCVLIISSPIIRSFVVQFTLSLLSPNAMTFTAAASDRKYDDPTHPVILQRRLATGVGSGTVAGAQRGSLTRAVSKLVGWHNTAATKHAAADAEINPESDSMKTDEAADGGASLSDIPATTTSVATAANECIRELEWVQIEMMKSVLYNERLQRELTSKGHSSSLPVAAASGSTRQSLEETIRQEKERVVRNRQILARIKRKRQQREQYEVMARQVIMSKYPVSTNLLQANLQKAQLQQKNLEHKLEQTTIMVHIRQSQFSSLLQSIADLKQSIKEEELDDQPTRSLGSEGSSQPFLVRQLLLSDEHPSTSVAADGSAGGSSSEQKESTPAEYDDLYGEL
jgi:hypothetical protein